MADYIQVGFAGIGREQAEILIARLSNEGYDGFEENETELKAFIAVAEFDERFILEISSDMAITFTTTIIAETNWNEVWESSFEPVIIKNFAAVRAHFHHPIHTVQHEIIITPKMSFGTGHHATTYMMMEQMEGIDFKGKDVFDFGTGTGVLAILAEKSGAANVFAMDIDEWSIENAMENCSRNACTRITIEKADAALMNRTFDITLANINKNVILENFETIVKQLKPGGILLLSGLLTEDEGDILEKSVAHKLQLRGKSENRNWLCLKLSH